MSRHGASLIALAALQWALLGPVARVAFAEGVPPLTVAFWRASIAACLFAIHASLTRAHPLRRTDRLYAMGLGVIAVAGLYVAYFEAVRLGGAALSAILLYSAPVWVAIGAHIVLREGVARHEALALRLTLGGVILVALFPAAGGAQIEVTPAAIAWGLGSGIAYAMYFLIGRPLFAHNAPARVMAWALATGAVVLAPFVSWQWLTWRAWGAIAFLATVATYGAYLSNANGIRLIGPSPCLHDRHAGAGAGRDCRLPALGGASLDHRARGSGSRRWRGTLGRARPLTVHHAARYLARQR